MLHQCILAFADLRYAQVPPSEQWLVQGDLLYRLEGVDSGDEEPGDVVVVDLPRTLDRSLPSAERRGGTSAPMQVRQFPHFRQA